MVAGITDKLRTKTDELQLNHLKKNQQILENSTDIRSESYWHQINRPGAWRVLTKEQVKKNTVWAVAGIMDELRTKRSKNVWEKNVNKF